MTSRIIKNELQIAPPKSKTIHPITLNIISNESNNPLCLTKFYFNKDKKMVMINANNKCGRVDTKNIMFVPPVSLSSSDILKIYNIESIDDLENWMDEEFDKLNYYGINRIINSWIRENYEIIKI